MRTSGSSPTVPMFHPVRAGPVTAWLNGSDLRRIQVGKLEIIRRIGFTVRTSSWVAVRPELEHVELETGPDSFTSIASVRFEDGTLRLDATVTIKGTPDGVVNYNFASAARSDFDYNRIGILLLHPASLGGSHFTLGNDDVPHSAAAPVLVEPQWFVEGQPRNMWIPFRTLDIKISHGLVVKHEFTGEVFEMEDQRNWGDSTYKIYPMPLGAGWPRRVSAGQPIEQTVRVSLSGEIPEYTGAAHSSETITVTGTRLAHRYPAIGFTLGSGLAEDGEALDLLRRVRCDHIQTKRENETQATRVASRLDAALELVRTARSFNDPLPDGEIARLVAAEASRSSPPTMVDSSHPAVLDILLAPREQFVELNGLRPLPKGYRGVAFPFSPQFHDTDDLTIIENHQSVPAMVNTARALGAGDLVAVGPVTLRPQHPDRFEPDVRGEGPEPDPRQCTRLFLVWMLAMVSEFLEARVDSVTLCDLYGSNGIVDRDKESGQLMVTPAFYLYEHLEDLAQATPTRVEVSDDRAVAALAFTTDTRTTVLIGNLSHTHQDVLLMLPDVEPGSVHAVRLNVDDLTVSTFEPWETLPIGWASSPACCIHLEPFDYVRIEAGQDR